MRKLLLILVGLSLAPIPSLGNEFYAHVGDPNWVHDLVSTCWIYNASPGTQNAAIWTGKHCFVSEDAQGPGTVTWYKSGTFVYTQTGEMADGRFVVPATQDNSGSYSDYSSGGGSSYSPPASDSGDAYLETLKRQNRENCARAAQGANIPCNPQ